MKTAIIYNLVPEEIKFFVVDGDLCHLDGVYINNCEDEDLDNELTNLMYDEKGKYRLKEATMENFRQEIVNGAKLIMCGFIL